MTSSNTPRSLSLSLRRGFAGACPHCGKGKLFRAYLKVTDHCSACDESYTHQRADDLPAYIVLFIVGHIIVGALMSVDVEGLWPLWVHMVLWPSLTLILSLLLLQPVKGAVVGLQWALKMHGFATIADADQLPLFRSDEDRR